MAKHHPNSGLISIISKLVSQVELRGILLPVLESNSSDLFKLYEKLMTNKKTWSCAKINFYFAWQNLLRCLMITTHISLRQGVETSVFTLRFFWNEFAGAAHQLCFRLSINISRNSPGRQYCVKRRPHGNKWLEEHKGVAVIPSSLFEWQCVSWSRVPILTLRISALCLELPCWTFSEPSWEKQYNLKRKACKHPTFRFQVSWGFLEVRKQETVWAVVNSSSNYSQFQTTLLYTFIWFLRESGVFLQMPAKSPEIPSSKHFQQYLKFICHRSWAGPICISHFCNEPHY